jgi:putative ABC transport system permease protein
MFKPNFEIAWRNLVRHKQFTILNLLGLSTGLACVLLIYLWISDELQVDKFNAKDSRLYVVLKRETDGTGAVVIGKNTQGLLANSLAAQLPEVEYAVQMTRRPINSILSNGEKHIGVHPQFAGKDFFHVFTYPLVGGNELVGGNGLASGNEVTAGNEDSVTGTTGIFISDALALKLFNSTAVDGKVVTWDYKDDNNTSYGGPYKITGVFKAPPANASTQFDMIVPFDLYAQKNAGTRGDVSFWGSNMVRTYVVLKNGTNSRTFNEKIKNFTTEKVKSLYPGKDLAKYEGSLFARRYSDGYLYNNYVNGVQAGGRIEYVRLFFIIAAFILVIACINFMNLSTAKAAGRMKEVGVRKAIGAGRGSLIGQYMGESMLMSWLSIFFAILLASLLLPAFREVTGKHLSITVNMGFILSVAVIAVITGLVAGSYPALHLSGFKPVVALKGKKDPSTSESAIRKGLVVFQFSISAILIISVLVIYRQMKLIQTKNLGYTNDHILRFASVGGLADHPDAFLTKVSGIPGVAEAASMSGDFLGNAGHSGGGIGWPGKDPNLGVEFFGVSGDHNYMGLLGLKMAAGRPFYKNGGIDTSSVIFNQSAIAIMGLKDPIGKIVSLWGVKKRIIGVVCDFHFESLYKRVGPAFLEYISGNPEILVKIKAGSENETLGRLGRMFRQFNPGVPFAYRFLEDDYQAMYSSEQKVSILSKYFAGIAIIISCLGLFGLAAFTAQQRQKEIGIRKVVGASVRNIAVLLSQDFLKLVVLGLLIAFPVASWVMTRWLNGFAYRVPLSADVYLLAAGAILVITVLTIGVQALKAAVANPTDSLRAE